MIIDDYIEYTRVYKEKYGSEFTIVLMQVGSFYELYSITDDTTADIYKIADICNIQISRKNKTISEVSISNPLMAGFPLYTLSKFTGLLLQHNYTIVLVEQVSEPPNPIREVTEILSPGMNINITTKKSNYIMVLYYEIINNLIIAGISGIDLTTGHNFIFEIASTKSDPDLSYDEVYRIIATYNPCEIVFLSSDKLSDDIKHNILKNLNINNILVHYKWENYEYIEIMKKIVYQKAILEKAYSVKKSMLSIIELLNLDKYNNARISLCCLLQFAYEHNADIIKNLNIPEIFENNKILTIEYNSAVQLNLIGLHSGDKPLIDILNRCSTSFGSRVFKERLLNPIVNIEELNKRYDYIDYLLKDCKFKTLNKYLNNILDLERIKRKMIINKFHPMDWCGFNTSLENALLAASIVKEIDKEEINDIIIKLKNSYDKIIDLNLATKYNLSDIKGTIFYNGTHKDIDEISNEYSESYNKIVTICSKISNLDNTGGDSTCCKIEYNERDGHYISITKKRYENALSKSFDYINKFEKKSLNTSSNILKLTNRDIINASNNIEKCQILLSSVVLKEYKEFVTKFIIDNGDNLDKLICFLTNLDISCCNAKNAFDYRYYRPNIFAENEGNNNNSFVLADNVRHPIIERIDDSVPYIGNDININSNGILLYGINASGKSSFMKMIGLNIIMAQSGMFVASHKFNFKLYHHIFTRISGMDNIYKGMSSFTVEMTELRNILQRCDKNSLVLGDEICCGTESISALAIVAAGIDSLIKKKSSFIFATHLHELTELEIIKSLVLNKTLKINHMHISIDDNNRIIYERVIKEGQGSSIYGLEVCKSLDMPYDFMKIAENTRKEVQSLNSLIINIQKSKYNKEVIMLKCAICGNNSIDTHHIDYQSNADDNGYFKNYHKNNKHNLVPLCKDCHNKEHNGEISINGYTKTSEGVILDVNPQNSDRSHLETNEKPLCNYDYDYEKCFLYIRKGKLNWFSRRTKTSGFKKCTNELKILEHINKILKTSFTNIHDVIHNKLYDPTL
jgi:DNA mismatch repair protein MutS